VDKHRGSPKKDWGRQLRVVVRRGVRWSAPVLLFVFIFVLTTPVSDVPSIVMVRARHAQEIVDTLRAALPIPNDVQIALVIYQPLVFTVEPMDPRKDHFRLSMEIGFLLMLDDDELRAALAHELGHVWIYTHHPYLQTERLANNIGLRLANRDSFERLYRKLWAYEGTTGVPIDELLGPREESSTPAIPASGAAP
jgi:hypothetical protein